MAEQVIADIRELGLDLLDPKYTGDLAALRSFEFAATLNRMRDFQASQLEQ